MIRRLCLLFIVLRILPLTLLRSLALIIKAIVKAITQVITGLGAHLAMAVTTLHAGTVRPWRLAR